MKITFLGTGTSQGVPMIGCECEVCKSDNPKDKRLRTSILIEHDGRNVVIDTGPDFRQQMLTENVSTLEAVVFTHEHKDHIAGMDDIRAYNYLQQKDMDIYATPRVQEALKRDFFYAFNNSTYPGVPKAVLHTIEHGVPFDLIGLRFIPFEVMHMKLSVTAFRIGDFCYITDANFISEEEKKIIRGSKIIVINALRREKHVSHFTLDEAVDFMKELAPEKGYFVHMSHQIGKHDEVNAELPAFIKLAYDGLTLNTE
ncbi:MAG: MBL fold metallo-hydrolase [Bacteroidetes bacterium]|nr:MBL fold metallo-hydrolase [Bacteroidota bacterium]